VEKGGVLLGGGGGGDDECKVNAKCTLVQAMRLCAGRTARRGSRGIAVLYRH